MVKSPLTFFQKQVKMFTWDTIKFSHMSLCLIPKVFNTIDMILLTSKVGTMVDSKMLKA